MKNNVANFQKVVDKFLVRHRSILDVISKSQESCARINRAIAKAVTNCGCLKVKAQKQKVPAQAKLAEAKRYMKSHLEGELCESCSEIIKTEVGTTLFYLAATCSLLGLDLKEIIEQEQERISTLGIFSLT